MATPQQVRRRGRFGLILGTVLAFVAFAAVAYGGDLKVDANVDAGGAQTNHDLGNVIGGNTYQIQAAVWFQGGPDRVTSVTFAADGSLPSFVSSVTGGTATRASGTGESTKVSSTTTVVAPCTTGTFGAIVEGGGSTKIAAAAVQYAVTAVNAGAQLNDVSVGTAFVNIRGNVTSLGSNCGGSTPPPNAAPNVDAGGLYEGGEGSDIALDGGTASDADGPGPLSHLWTIESSSVGTGSCSLMNATSLTEATINCSDNGTATVKLTSTEAGPGLSGSDTASVTVNNVAPTAQLSNNGSVSEGSAVSVSFSNQADASSVDAAAGFRYSFNCNNDASQLATTHAGAASSTSANCTFGDNGSKTVVARIFDKDNGYNDYTTVVSVTNVAPSLNTPTFSFNPYTGVASAGISFSDPGWLDIVSSSFDWAGTAKAGSPATRGPAASGPLTGSFTSTHTFAAGCITEAIGVAVSDDDGGQASHTFAQANTLSRYNAGFLAPIKDGVRQIVKLGNVVPVKLSVIDSCSGNAILTRTLSIRLVSGVVDPADVEDGTEVMPTSVSSADTTGVLRVADGQYMYNLGTKGLSTGLPYTILIRDTTGTAWAAGLHVATAVIEARK